MELRTKVSGFDRIFSVNAERISDIKEPLAEVGSAIRADSKETFAKEASRSGAQWEPLAASTRQRLEQTTAGPVDVRGNVREKYVQQVSQYLRRKQKAGQYNPLVGQEFYRLTHGGSANEAIDQSVRKAFPRLRAALRKSEEKRRSGKRLSASHKMLGKMASMIRLRINKTGLSVGILKDSPLAIHNEGGVGNNGAKIPARTFIELLESDLDILCEKLVDWVVADKE